MKRILTIDGGGMRGYIPAAIIVELERRSGKQCCEIFDLIAGTSIGGILASLLSIGMPASEAMKFFTVDGKMIFKKHWWRAFGLIVPRYAAEPIERVLQKRLAGASKKDCKTKLLVTSLELKSQQPFFFKNYESSKDELLWKIARATSAAQTYFPAFFWRDPTGDKTFWDGGNVANNPSLCAYADAIKLWGDESEMNFLSLGCGSQTVSFSAKKIINGGALRAAAATIGMLFEAGSEDVDYQMNQILGNDYIRIQPEISESIALDDASENGLSKLNRAAMNCIYENSHILDNFIRNL